MAAGIKNTDCYAFMRNDNTLQVNQNTLLRQSDNQQPLALQEMMIPMKRKAIRNRDQERVLDILVDKDKDKIVLETKIATICPMPGGPAVSQGQRGIFVTLGLFSVVELCRSSAVMQLR